MQDREFHVDDRIDLGQASTETKGQAVFDIDPGTGRLNYLAGIVAE